METQNDLFGLYEYIERPNRKRSVCGCFISDCHCVKLKAIENYFKSGKELTVLDAVKLFKTMELRKYVSMLKQRGMNISGTWVFNPGVKFKAYKLVKDGTDPAK